MRRVTVEPALMRDALDELRVNTTDDRDYRASFVRALARELDALSTLPSVVADELRLRLGGVRTCHECDGEGGFLLVEVVDDHLDVLETCQACAGRGAVPLADAH